MSMLGTVKGAPTTPEVQVSQPSKGADVFVGWDCENPKRVQAMALPEGCDLKPTLKNKGGQVPRAWKVLQETTYFTYPATVCTMRRSSTVFSCAWKSHYVLANPLETYCQVRTQVGDCRYWSETLRYEGPNGQMYNLVGNGVQNNLKLVVRGRVDIENGYPHCQGVPFTSGGKFLYEGVEVQDVQITLRTVTVRENFDTGNRQIVEDGYEVRQSAVHNGGAIGSQDTYVFHRPEKVPCRHQITKEFEAQMVVQADGQKILIDEESQIHISARSLKHTPPGCPDTKGVRGYYTTKHSDITVVEVERGVRTEGLIPIDSHQIHVGPFVELKAEWLLFVMSKKLATMSNFQGNQKCQSLQSMWREDIPSIHDDSEKLLLHRGELLYAITCTKRTVVLDTDRRQCYKFLPVLVHGGSGGPQRRFLTPGSRLLVNSSTVEDCGVSRLSPRGYRNTAGTWVAMQPGPTPLRKPSTMDITLADLGLDRAAKDAGGGAYSPEDLKEYSLSYEWPLREKSGRSYADSILRGVDQGAMWETYQRDDLEDYFQRISKKVGSPLSTLWGWFTGKVLPWLNMVGSSCSIFVCLMGSAVSLIAVSQYIKDSKAHALVVNMTTIMRILCCSPLAVMTDPNYRASIANYAVGQANHNKEATQSHATGQPKCKQFLREDEGVNGLTGQDQRPDKVDNHG